MFLGCSSSPKTIAGSSMGSSLSGAVLVAPPPTLGTSLGAPSSTSGLSTSLGGPGGTPGLQRARQSSLTSQMAAR